jgi:hypothetical protein
MLKLLLNSTWVEHELNILSIRTNQLQLVRLLYYLLLQQQIEMALLMWKLHRLLKL